MFIACLCSKPASVMARVSTGRNGGKGGSSGDKDTSGDSNRLHAMVEWEDGAEAGQITHNVDVDWILDFDAASPEFPETYAIEWRVPPRPRNGWPVLNGRVLDVSCKFPFHLLLFSLSPFHPLLMDVCLICPLSCFTVTPGT